MKILKEKNFRLSKIFPLSILPLDTISNFFFKSQNWDFFAVSNFSRLANFSFSSLIYLTFKSPPFLIHQIKCHSEEDEVVAAAALEVVLAAVMAAVSVEEVLHSNRDPQTEC